jgi:hypothetical protein
VADGREYACHVAAGDSGGLGVAESGTPQRLCQCGEVAFSVVASHQAGDAVHIGADTHVVGAGGAGEVIGMAGEVVWVGDPLALVAERPQADQSAGGFDRADFVVAEVAGEVVQRPRAGV